MPTLTLMVMETTLAQDCKNFNSTCSLHGNHPQLLKRNIYFCIYVFGLQKWYIYVNAICTSAKTGRFSPVAVRLIKHRPVPGRASSGARTGIGRFVKRCSWRLSDIVRCLAGHRTVPSRAPFESYDNFLYKNRPVPVRCVQTPAGLRPGTARCPADVILPLMTLTNAVRAPWNFKYM